jgi:hypothetical protein
VRQPTFKKSIHSCGPFMVRSAIINFSAVVNFPQKTREPLGWFRLENDTCQVKEICSQANLSCKALYLRPYEYWSHPMHVNKHLGTGISACAEYSMLYNNSLSIKLVNHSRPSCQNHPDFPCHLLSQFTNCPLNKDQHSWAIWPESTRFLQCLRPALTIYCYYFQ